MDAKLIKINQMSLQAQIDFMNSVKAEDAAQIVTNSAQISGINDIITSLNSQISGYQQEIADLQAANTGLTEDIAMCDTIIATLSQ